VLLLGGPAHGQERDLTEFGQKEMVIMAPSPGNPLPTPWTYQVKEIEAETRPGVVYRQRVLVEKNMPVEVATDALAQILLTKFASELVRQFMEGGELVGSSENKSGILTAR
jgi:hypothetical protein